MQSKKYDIFISNFSSDKAVAERVTQWLSEKGLRVWYDSWEILVGHDIVDEVYRGIRESRFLLVLLSISSINSRWVQEEVNAAKITEFELGSTVVLPCIIDADAKTAIPESLRTKRYADIAEDFDRALSEVEYAVSAMHSTQTVPAAAGIRAIPPSQSQSIEQSVADMEAHDWPIGETFRQVVITPSGNVLSLRKADLGSMIDKCTIEIAGWGGASFPYRRSYNSVNARYHSDGLAIVATRVWYHRHWSFNYWYVSESGYFLARNSWDEDHDPDFSTKVLGLEWLNLWVVSALLFARRLQEVESYPDASVQLHLCGMKDRYLTILNRRRWGFHHKYTAHDNDIEIEVPVGPQTDLVEVRLQSVLDIVWRFGWVPSPDESLRADITALCSGRVPG